jgi:hypothetical protein
MSKKQSFIPLKLTVKVTKEHIKKGTVWSDDSCPIALALKDQGFKGVFVPGEQFTVKFGKFNLTYGLPVKADLFIEKFDNEMLVKPFSFMAELVEAENPSRYES